LEGVDRRRTPSPVIVQIPPVLWATQTEEAEGNIPFGGF